MSLLSLYVLVANLLSMLGENCLVWNVRGLNSRARRDVVRELVDNENILLLSIQETKIVDFPDALLGKFAAQDLIFSFSRHVALAVGSYLLGIPVSDRSLTL